MERSGDSLFAPRPSPFVKSMKPAKLAIFVGRMTPRQIKLNYIRNLTVFAEELQKSGIDVVFDGDGQTQMTRSRIREHRELGLIDAETDVVLYAHGLFNKSTGHHEADEAPTIELLEELSEVQAKGIEKHRSLGGNVHVWSCFSQALDDEIPRNHELRRGRPTFLYGRGNIISDDVTFVFFQRIARYFSLAEKHPLVIDPLYLREMIAQVIGEKITMLGGSRELDGQVLPSAKSEKESVECRRRAKASRRAHEANCGISEEDSEDEETRKTREILHIATSLGSHINAMDDKTVVNFIASSSGVLQRLGDLHPLYVFEIARRTPRALHKRSYSDVIASDSNGKTPLMMAASSDERDVAEDLLANGVDISERDKLGRTPLHYAAISDSDSTVVSLCTHGAEIDAADKAGRTPLALAASHGRETTMISLIRRGANLHLRDRHGETALHKAKDDACRDALLEAGASVDVADFGGQTALMRVCRQATDPKLLMKAIGGSNAIDARDRGGRTALFHAISAQNVEAVAQLLAGGAQPTTEASDGKNALDFARVHAKDSNDPERIDTAEKICRLLEG
jgi:ankyrin repeat protein